MQEFGEIFQQFSLIIDILLSGQNIPICRSEQRWMIMLKHSVGLRLIVRYNHITILGMQCSGLVVESLAED